MATNTEKIVVQVVVKGQKDLNSASKQAESTGNSFAVMAGRIGLAVTAFAQITKVVSSALKTFTKFEFSMAKVRAITGATEKDFKKLSATAQQLGRTTFFTASQVAELQINFGKLGFSTAEILEAQEATLLLATATQTDLGRAAIVAGAAVRGFQLDASETARVVDVMAVAFTSSALDIEKFQTSMTKVAPIAAAAGISLESTTAIMGTLTDAGIEASIAGTSLRNIFLKMQDPTSELSKRLGFTVNSSEDLEKAMKMLNEANLSNAEILELVDLRQAAAFITMIEGTDSIIDMTDALDVANGSAQEMADIMADTLQGDVFKVKSAWEGFTIALVEGNNEISRSIREALQVTATFLNILTDDLKDADQLAADIFSKTMDVAKTQVKEMNELAEQQNDEGLSTTLAQSLGGAVNELEGELARLESVVDDRTGLQKYLQNVGDTFLGNLVGLRQENDKFYDDLPKKIEATRIALEDLKAQQKDLSDKEAKQAELDLENRMKDLEKLDRAKVRNAKRTARELEQIRRDQERKEKEDFKNSEEALKNALTAEINAEKENLINGLITQEEFNNRVFEAEMAHLDMMRDLRIAYGEDVVDIEGKILDAELKRITDSRKAAEDSDRDDAKEKSDQIKRMQEIGNQLIFIAGEEKELQGLKKLGIQISQASAVASGIEAVAKAQLAIADAAADSPWFLKVFNIIALVAAMASTLASARGLFRSFGEGGVVETFANGGMVHGRSHAQGGEKFAVGGRVVELEGGEAVINKRSTAMFRSQLSAMNVAGGGVKFADGGMLNTPSFQQQQFNALNQNQMLGSLDQSRKVVVVEADITETQQAVNVIQAQATF
jgi:TP901 family phage tail tape measure protein